MSTLVCHRIHEKDFHTYSKDWTNKIERKFGKTAGKQFLDVLNDQYASKDELLNDLEDSNWYDSLIMDRLHSYKSAYMNKDFCNTFYHTLKTIINGTDWSSVQETYKLNNNIFDECIRKELENIGYNKEGIMRISWRVNSFCLIYSRTDKQWCIGKITKIFTNKTNEEWLLVKYGNKIKNIQRFCKYIKPIISNETVLNNNKISNKNVVHMTEKKKIKNNGLTFHFYGIKTSNYSFQEYQNTYRLFFPNLEQSLLVSIHSKLKTNDNILSLKRLIYKTYNISSDNDILIIFGNNIISSNNKLKLRNFGITNNSLLLIAINCDKNKMKSKNINNDTKWNYTLSIKTKKGFDIITQESNTELFQMPSCGHYLSKDSLYNYAYNQLKDGNNLYISCPHKCDNESDMKYNEWIEWSCSYCTYLNGIDTNICEMCENVKKPKKMFCEQEWNYSLIKQILSFNNENNWFDISKLELLLARNKTQTQCNIQKCPKCKSIYYKNNNDYELNNIKTKYDIKKAFKTECEICKCNWNNSFCFCCGKEWIYGHVCDNSFKFELINILNNAQTKKIGEVDNVPSIRSCPNCAQLITHTEACKHMNCSQCDTDFCFVCLSICTEDDGWQCGSSGDVCPIAPIQNMKSLPNTVVINKKAFQLF